MNDAKAVEEEDAKARDNEKKWKLPRKRTNEENQSQPAGKTRDESYKKDTNK